MIRSLAQSHCRTAAQGRAQTVHLAEAEQREVTMRNSHSVWFHFGSTSRGNGTGGIIKVVDRCPSPGFPQPDSKAMLRLHCGNRVKEQINTKYLANHPHTRSVRAQSRIEHTGGFDMSKKVSCDLFLQKCEIYFFPFVLVHLLFMHQWDRLAVTLVSTVCVIRNCNIRQQKWRK